MTNAEIIRSATSLENVFTKGPYTATVTNVHVPAGNNDQLSGWVVVTLGEEVIYQGECNVINPPLIHPAPDGDIIKGGDRLLDELSGEETFTPMVQCSNDPMGALRTIIFDALATVIS